MDQQYFPGRDYPDRQKWLAVRYTPRRLNRGIPVYTGDKPVNIGMNRAKRMARAKDVRDRTMLVHMASLMPAGSARVPKQHYAHTRLVKIRHAARRNHE